MFLLLRLEMQTFIVVIIIMLSMGGKDDQLVKVQKEILTNYYMQKYNTIMGNLHSQPTIKDDQISAHK